MFSLLLFGNRSRNFVKHITEYFDINVRDVDTAPMIHLKYFSDISGLPEAETTTIIVFGCRAKILSSIPSFKGSLMSSSLHQVIDFVVEGKLV